MPENRTQDTIAALATPFGEGGLAVIRLSGPEAFSIAAKIFFPAQGDLFAFKSHTIHFGEIRRERDGEPVDQALVSLFRAPHSYTGEDVIEISTHGGMVVSRTLLDLLIEKGAKHAEPGAFTKRAFLNGRMDLTQAEAVLDLIRAKSQKSLQTAVRQLTGSLSTVLKEIKQELMHLYAHMEAYVDFPDEHLEVYGDREFLEKFRPLARKMRDLIRGFERGALLREGISAVILGRPNVGKSSLFNALLSRDRALVSEFPGTTRDRLEEAVEIGGYYIRLIDTAGLGTETSDPVERLGMERSLAAVREADLFLYIVDGSSPLSPADRAVYETIEKACPLKAGDDPAVSARPLVVVVSKCDLPPALDAAELFRLTGQSEPVRLSAKTREGLDQLEAKLADSIHEWNRTVAGEGEQITRLRHRHALAAALESLERAEQAFRNRESLEFVTVDLKQSLDAMKELVGEIYSEDLLDVIFSEFCIGK